MNSLIDLLSSSRPPSVFALVLFLSRVLHGARRAPSLNLLAVTFRFRRAGAPRDSLVTSACCVRPAYRFTFCSAPSVCESERVGFGFVFLEDRQPLISRGNLCSGPLRRGTLGHESRDNRLHLLLFLSLHTLKVSSKIQFFSNLIEFFIHFLKR